MCDFLKDPSSKYGIGFDEWPWNNLPQFLLGGVYVLTQEAIFPLLSAIQTTPMIHLEDVYLTGICAEKTNVEIKNSSYFM